MSLSASGQYQSAVSNGVSIYVSTASSNRATNLDGGVIGDIPYQSASNITSFLTGGAAGQVLVSGGVGLAPKWMTLTGTNLVWS